MASKKLTELIITCNAKGLQNILETINKRVAEIKERMQALNAEGAKNGWTKGMESEMKALQSEATALNSITTATQKSLAAFGNVIKDLANAPLRELKKGLNEGKASLAKMSERDPNRETLIKQLRDIAKQMDVVAGKAMSMREVMNNLKNLGNLSMDRLNQGLQTVRERLSNGNLHEKARANYQNIERQLSAEAALRQSQQVVSTAPVNTLGIQQLRAEQSALRNAAGAFSGVKGYEGKLQEYQTRLRAVNEELYRMEKAEQTATNAIRNKVDAEQADNTYQQVINGQKVSIEELTQAQKTYEAQARRFTGIDPKAAQQAQQRADAIARKIRNLTKATLSNKEINDRVANSGKYNVKQLQEAYDQLNQKLQTLSTSQTGAADAIRRKMKSLRQDIDRASGSVSGFAKAWQTVKQNVMMYVGVFAIVNKIRSAISGLISQNKALSDSMANIRKVSQWASTDVEQLTRNLAKIDTRNTQQTLQNLAYQGAKLGIGQYGVEGLTGFVRAAEQVQTALGEDLGEDALPELAKLTEVMGLIPKYGVEEAMQKAGSAIYQLGATSTATGKNIVEFSKRLMGLANVSGITADQLLGLGSAADSMALMPEVAATAFNKVFNSIQSNTAGIANAVGIAKEELQNLIYEGRTMDAIVAVFEKMRSMSMAELEGRNVFKELGSDGARLTNVMITMSNKIDMLKSHLDTSNKAFAEGKAVINEYMIQQETAAAYAERAANMWTKAFINPQGVDVVKEMTQAWYDASYEMTHSLSTMTSIKLTLEMLAKAAVAIIKILPHLIQLMMFYGVGAAVQGVVGYFMALHRAIALAAAGVSRFNLMLKTNAVALAITGVAFLVTKLVELKKASDAAARAEEERQKVIDDAAAAAIQSYNKQKKALDAYTEAVKKTGDAEGDRQKIIDQFKSDYKSYLDKLGIEVETWQDMENAIHRVNEELRQKAYYDTAEKLRQNYVGDAEAEQTAAMSKYMQAAQKYGLPMKTMNDIIEGKVTNTLSEFGPNSEFYKQKYLPSREERMRKNGWTQDWQYSKDYKEFAPVVTQLIKTSAEVRTRNGQVDKFLKDNGADQYSDLMSVDAAIRQLADLKNLTENKIGEALTVLRNQWKDMSENDRNTERGKEISSAIDQYVKHLRSMKGEGYTPPPTAKEIRAATESARKEAERGVKAVIDNVKNYYQRQISAVIQSANLGQRSKQAQENIVSGLESRMRMALSNVRKAIGGVDNDWEEFRATMRADLYEPLDGQGENLSTDLLERIMSNNLEDLRTAIQNLSKQLNKDGNQLLDQILRKATEDELGDAKSFNKQMRARQQELLAKNYTGKVDLDYEDKMEQFGIAELSDPMWTQMQQWSQQDKAEEIAKFFADRSNAWRDAFANARKNLTQILMADASTASGRDIILRLLFGDDYATKLAGTSLQKFLDMSDDKWQVFYQKLIEYTDAWTDAQKKAYDEVKKREDYLFENRPEIVSINNIASQLQQAQTQQDMFGGNLSFGRQLGVVDTIQSDPELMRLDLLQAKAEMYYNRMAELRNKDAASEAELQAAQQAMAEAQMATQQRLANIIKDRTDVIRNAIGPVTDFAEQAGQKLGDMMFNMDSQSMTWNQIWKNMLLAMGKSIIQMGEQYAIQQLQRSMFNKQIESDEMMHQSLLTAIALGGALARMEGEFAIDEGRLIQKKVVDGEEITEEVSLATILTALGISEGSAKTIGTLGWWGIPLIAVISSVLMGLLTSALATAGASNESSAAPKVKLASGMLTYDKGNVHTYLGDDGRVYRAREDAAPQDGLVTQPIATTVQGQPALVAERGPEIVIGRETTRAIQTYEPQLIDYLANYQPPSQRLRSGFPTFDSGNLQQGVSSVDGADSAAANQTLADLTAAITLLQQQLAGGIHAKVNMWGNEGLYETSQQASRFMSRYNRRK